MDGYKPVLWMCAAVLAINLTLNIFVSMRQEKSLSAYRECLATAERISGNPVAAQNRWSALVCRMD